ncbi:MAG: glycerophosphodiester phosphodiesterase family protein [Pseudomonadota bacterium]
MTINWSFKDAPAVVAHRGFAGRYPENTVLSLAAAVAFGARFLELDVQLTRDGVPVVCHDPTLERCGNDPRSVLEHTWNEIRSVDVGEVKRLGPSYAHTGLSTLEDVARHLNSWPPTTTFVEIKQHSTDAFGVEFTVRQVLDALASLRHPFVILSFVDDVIPEARRQGARQTGWVVTDWNTASRETLAALDPDYVYCNQDKIATSDALWPGRWHWVLYEVTREEDAKRWRDAGAAMIESMHPDRFIAR